MGIEKEVHPEDNGLVTSNKTTFQRPIVNLGEVETLPCANFLSCYKFAILVQYLHPKVLWLYLAKLPSTMILHADVPVSADACYVTVIATPLDPLPEQPARKC